MTKTFVQEVNRPEHYAELTDEKKKSLTDWIKEYLEPFRIQSYGDYPTSYGLKHRFENSKNGFYVTNGQFKGAMLECGFEPKDPKAINAVYQLSKKAGVKR